MADSAVEFLLENLKQLALEWWEETVNAEVNGRRLINETRDELLLLTSGREGTDTGRADDEISRRTTREMRDLAYRFLNLTEKFDLVLFSRREKCFPFMRFLSRFSCVGSSDLREISREITRIKFMAENLSLYNQDNQRYGLRSGDFREEERSCVIYTAEELEKYWVGREEDMKHLLSYIVERKECRVISLCGMGGSGKTFLANKLYVQSHDYFDAFAWVHVSQNLVKRDVLVQLYTQLHPNSNSNLSDTELRRDVYQIQLERRCLIVLDNVWSTDVFQAFPSGGNTNTKILLTTQLMEVAENVKINAEMTYVHNVRPLADDESLQLYMKRTSLAQIPDSEVNRTIMELGMKLVSFSEGLPLAIVSFVHYMLGTYEPMPLRGLLEGLQHFTANIQNIWGIEDTLKILTLSYVNLPHYLIQCFLYLGPFLEEPDIEAEKVYLLWLAEGLVTLGDCGREETLMDVAERYLNELARRSMVELHEAEEPTITRFKSCQVNRLMRILCLSKNRDEDFFKFIDFQDESLMSSDSYSSSNKEAYRLSISLDKCKPEDDLPFENKQISCLLLKVKENQHGLVWPKKLATLIKFKYLKTLVFSGFDFQETKLPRGIGTLIQLRYLSFNGCILPKLPSSIGNMTFLYILDLRVQLTSDIIIPNVLWKMKKLKHLYFPLSFKTCGACKLRLDGLTDLETLTNFNSAMFNFEDLFTLSKLRYLVSNVTGDDLQEIEGIIKRMRIDSDVQILRTALEISSFDCYTYERDSLLGQLLGCQSLTALSIKGHIGQIPHTGEISQNLVKIAFIGAELTDDPMKTLEHLPMLRVLILDHNAFVGTEMICAASGFKELKRLELLNLQYLHKWTVQKGALPKLSALAIKKCEELIMSSHELQFCCCLQEVNVSQMNEDFKASLIMVKQQIREVPQGPSITIKD